MKPFNLERALAGDPVITRDGRKVYDLKLFDSANEDKLGGVVEGIIHSWKINGVFCTGGESTYDLFMQGKPKKKLWIAIHRYSDHEGDHETSRYAYAKINKERLKCFDENLFELIEIEI